MTNKKMIMLSNLEIWSLEEGKGAPSFYNTIKAYAEDGWDITLIRPISKYRKDYKVEGCKIIEFNNGFFDYLNSIPKIRFFARFFAHFYATKMFIKLSEDIIINSKDVPIIYAYEIFGVEAGRNLQRRYGCPFVTRFQGTILVNYKKTFYNRIRKYPHFNALSQKCDLVIMTDDGTKGEEILKKLGNTSEVLFLKNGQNPVKKAFDIDKANKEIRKKLKIDYNCPILLTVSRLQNWKKVDRAILLLKEVLIDYPSTKLIIVGDGEEYDNLVELAKKEKIKSSVLFAGSVKQEEVWKYYSCANIFLSLYDLSNVGNPLMEAMRYGKSIITLDNGDTKKMISNNINGILVQPDNINYISKAVIDLFNNHEKLKQLGANAKKFAESNFWTWNDRMKFELKKVESLFKRKK